MGHAFMLDLISWGQTSGLVPTIKQREEFSLMTILALILGQHLECFSEYPTRYVKASVVASFPGKRSVVHVERCWSVDLKAFRD
ncbi:HEAT repeat family protein [Musa troglodytarum]|uniref:HEAT repeat family protein n=1 Tax=Musa troglodytarum TaxID=320322 RepID=A0A9E7JDT2_9LILI|nr:HEAT repeat family protein [Musa troglodytarum]